MRLFGSGSGVGRQPPSAGEERPGRVLQIHSIPISRSSFFKSWPMSPSLFLYHDTIPPWRGEPTKKNWGRRVKRGMSTTRKFEVSSFDFRANAWGRQKEERGREKQGGWMRQGFKYSKFANALPRSFFPPSHSSLVTHSSFSLVPSLLICAFPSSYHCRSFLLVIRISSLTSTP